MKYVGGKHRFARDIIKQLPSTASRIYIEPFCGSAAVLSQVSALRRIANDQHPYLVALLIRVSEGYLPPTSVDEQLYYDCKNRPDAYPPELVGFVGFACSFGAKWFGGYARGTSRNYAAEGVRNLQRMAPLLQDIEWHCGDYRDVSIPQGESCVIYCDPPYQGTQGYGETFDSVLFFDWCREWAHYHDVYVSEYTAPPDFECIWSKERAASLDLNTGGKVSTERLFKVSS